MRGATRRVNDELTPRSVLEQTIDEVQNAIGDPGGDPADLSQLKRNIDGLVQDGEALYQDGERLFQ